MEKILRSEIIRQKKEFIFNVEQTSNYVFPNEEYYYFVYIKNMSETQIDNFFIRIEASPEVYIEQIENKEDTPITLKKGESLLYEFKAKINSPGEYHVHFIGNGDETEIIHQNLKIKCSRTYNSEKLIHRINIYNFTPYEDNFLMEASNYNDEVTQTLKRQKLPFKAGEQPYHLISQDHIENVESESYLNQYNKAKNTKEHVYHYISRENFEKNSLESYEGKNLYEIFNDINKNSKYFNATFFKTGTNTLLNDFTQYKPNGFIYRMGLLSSEIYQTLGVIPTYSYMSDKLFRWAPSPSGQHLFMDEEAKYDLIDLYPKPKSMSWGENIWAGRGWIIYKKPTDEYKQTEEFQEKFSNKLISLKEKIGVFEEKKDAEMFIEQREYFDEVVRNQTRSSLIEYEYEMEESLYDSGVFFINIPIDKIPTNFYLIDTDELYNIINRAKPYGVKPIINYIINKEFNLDLKCNLIPEYIKNFESDIGDIDAKYYVCENKFIQESINCDNQTINIIREKPVKCVFYNNDFNLNYQLDVDYSKIGINFDKPDSFNTLNIEKEYTEYIGSPDQDFRKLINILDLLYKNNYNNIAFKMDPQSFGYITSEEYKFTTTDNITRIGSSEVEGIKLPIYSKYEQQSIPRTLFIKDSFDRYHKFYVEYEPLYESYHIKYIYENSKGKEYVRKEGIQDIDGLIIGIANYNNRKILIFMVEDLNKEIHYFYHTIVEDITDFGSTGGTTDEVLFKPKLLNQNIKFETPFCYNLGEYEIGYISGGDNWDNLYRINNISTSYSYIQNKTQGAISPDTIYLHFDEINIPKTSIIKDASIILEGNTFKKNIYLDKAIGQNYKVPEVNGYSINLKPESIIHYPKDRESNLYYQEKLNQAEKKGQTQLIEYYNNLMDKNDLFNEMINTEVSDYMNNYEDYIKISDNFWSELYDFTDINNNLNDTKNISLIIEGFNEGDEVKLLSQVVSEADRSSIVETKVPSGYFFLETPLLYSNSFLLKLFRVRFRFYGLNHQIKLFNTTLDVDFKNKQDDSISFDFIGEKNFSEKENVTILQDDFYPQDLNNGLCLKISFDDLDAGELYQIKTAKLFIVYKNTDVKLMINKNKYRYVPIGESQTTIFGTNTNSYISGEFYNDICTVSQLESNIGLENEGVRLEDTIYQSFEAHDDNITSIELFPNGFIGNPDETLKIGLYTNHNNTPNKLIKEIYADGWTKINEELKNLPAIKYNLNIDNLTINETYWIKIQVLNPRDNSYYLLKSINKTQPRHKLLYMKNNNYINSFSSLTFNVYSKNLSRSFGKLPAIQEFFDNPYILIGLHRGQGIINNLLINKWNSTVKEDKHMKEYFDGEPEMILDDVDNEVFGIIIEDVNTKKKLKADFNNNTYYDLEE